MLVDIYTRDFQNLLSVVPQSPTQRLVLIDPELIFTGGGSWVTLKDGGSAPRFELGDPTATETAKASTAWIEGPAGIQLSMPGYCAL